MTTSFLFFASNLTGGEQAHLERTRQKLTQWEVAHKAGVPQWAISTYERGDRYVPPKWVSKIRITLGLEEGSDDA